MCCQLNYLINSKMMIEATKHTKKKEKKKRRINYGILKTIENKTDPVSHTILSDKLYYIHE